MTRLLSLTVGVLVLLAAVGGAAAADDIQAGKAKSGACAVCHGVQGQGVGPNVALAGKSEADIVQALQDFKSGKRAATVMKPFAGMLSDQDMANLGAFYASLK
jgi:cytochrome c553